MLKMFADHLAARRLVVGGGIGTVVLVIIYLLLGGDPQALFNSQCRSDRSCSLPAREPFRSCR
jgi:hypothetical protein